MQEIESLVGLIQSPEAGLTQKHEAFGQLVGRFQDMAYGCAYVVLEDAYLAQDAAQEAFIAAYQNLGQLLEPKAFPGWLRRIVLSQCHRLTRGRQMPVQSLDPTADLTSAQPEPPATFEQQELQNQVQAALNALPERQRITMVLFYISGYSQKEVAEFLEVSVPVVRKRLQRARDTLRHTMVELVRDELQTARPSNDNQFARSVQIATALETAALESQLATLETLLFEGVEVNARGRDGRTLLHWAAQRGHLEAVKLLLKNGADPTATDKLGQTPRQYALEQDHQEVARLLDRFGGAWEARPANKQLFAQLFQPARDMELVASESQFATLEVLLTDGFDVNTRDKNGQTLLHWAAQKGHLEAVELLLKNGAKPNIKDETGQTPLQRAEEKDYREIVDLLRQYEERV
ncbi:MAG: sigma-70 family RNA polymerase sigma factor [Anaerolineae bacterium]|nr:sigma-70 family RNA polymerase sigma factor [Anaerolineae bacterium]